MTDLGLRLVFLRLGMWGEILILCGIFLKLPAWVEPMTGVRSQVGPFGITIDI